MSGFTSQLLSVLEVFAISLVVRLVVRNRDRDVMVWGGLHTVVPVALVLSLPQGFPFRKEL